MLTVIQTPDEPRKRAAQMFFTVYYAEKGDRDAASFSRGKIDIGTGNGGII